LRLYFRLEGMNQIKRILASAILLAVTFCLSCSTPQPVQNPNIKANLHGTLAGHAEVVWQIIFSPDGQNLASCSADRTVKLWRVKDGAQVNILTGGSEHVYAVAFSADGQYLASGSREKGGVGMLWKQLAGERLSGDRGQTVRLWRVSDGTLQQVLAEHSGDVHSIALSPNAQWLASSGYDKTVKLWRLERSSAHVP
jgi:WD40 repeat protein